MSIFTMLMTIPQVLAIWVGHQAGGVSLLTWGTYFVSAILWFWFGIRNRTKIFICHVSGGSCSILLWLWELWFMA